MRGVNPAGYNRSQAHVLHEHNRRRHRGHDSARSLLIHIELLSVPCSRPLRAKGIAPEFDDYQLVERFWNRFGIMFSLVCGPYSYFEHIENGTGLTFWTLGNSQTRFQNLQKPIIIRSQTFPNLPTHVHKTFSRKGHNNKSFKHL